LSLSDNQKRQEKMLANGTSWANHGFTTGPRHFKLRLSLPFSSRLSRDNAAA